MTAWTFLYIYLGGGALIALRMAWHIRYRLDKYPNDRYSGCFDIEKPRLF